MALSPGSRLGPYEVVSLLGAGGMGEVYRARDPRLGREVAIKVLPPELARDDTRRRRFLQEARAASALNHPGIVAIHELESAEGVDFIVMEYVPGRTLDALIRSGLRLGEALRIAVGVADAVAAAHAAGIVHRDLKPANVMVTPEGGVKVLDFGLAKLVGPEEASGEDGTTLSEVERPSTLSRAGTIAGTPGYMSPEQVTGGRVDARSDVFAFGALLYEMVTRRRAFAGTTREETLRAVVGQEAKPPSEVVAGVPAELEKLILRCLRKEPERRFQHMSDVKVELQEIRETADSGVMRAGGVTRRPRHRLWLAGGLAVTVLVAGAGWLMWRSRGRELPPPRLVNLTSYRGSERQPALSPDSEQVAFSWEGEEDPGTVRPLRHIWVKFVDRSEVRQLTNAAGNDSYPSWSPDGRQIAFIRETPAGIRPVVRNACAISSQGGPERKISDLPVGPSQMAWTPDGRGVVVARSGVGNVEDPAAGALHMLYLDGASPVVLTRPPRGGFHRYPAFSPDGRELAYVEVRDTSRLSPAHIQVVGLERTFKPVGSAKNPPPIPAPAGRGLTWAPDGRSVVFGRAAVLPGEAYLFRVPTRGAASAERIELAGRGASSPFVSTRRQRLVFVRSLTEMDIWALDPGMPARPVVATTLDDREPTYSPDSRRIAFTSSRSGDAAEIWLADADGTHLVQLTRGPGRIAGSPRWSPDGRRIAYEAQGKGDIPDLWTIDVEGGGPRRLTNGPMGNSLACWSRDSRWIYFRRYDEHGADIWRVPADGGTPERITNNAVRSPEFVADRCAVSFDGRTLYYKRADGEAPLIAHPLDGSPEHVAVDCVASRAFDVGPDGVYYVGCRTAERDQPCLRLDPAGRRELLGRVEDAIDLAASPSGGPILFTRQTLRADLMMIENFR
jgi:serine/threonine protein kinase/dipeptidyl aminopeptidase/acylaminoacyl peptidase